MGRDTKEFEYGGLWLSKRRDGKSPDIWQITRYDAASRSILYSSTRERDLEAAKPKLIARAEMIKAKGKQEASDARVIPQLYLYWKEKGRANINHDQTGRSLKTFIAFLHQDEAGLNVVVADLLPVLFERFRRWRMAPHSFAIEWEGRTLPYSSEGVAGDTVDRNLNDIRAAIGHAQDNLRIPLAPRIRAVDPVHMNPLRDRVLTIEELGQIAWYAYHFPALFRFVALQVCTSVRPEAAKKFNPARQYDDRTGLIDLQPDAAPRTKKRHAIIPAIRPMKPVLRAWAREPFVPVDSNKTAWRNMRKALGLSADVFPKTIRHTIATLLFADESVPARELEPMLGHGSSLNRTSQIYAKYDPTRLRNATRALTTIWRQISREARRFDADHSLTSGRNEGGKFLSRRVEKC
jgi:integrase